MLCLFGFSPLCSAVLCPPVINQALDLHHLLPPAPLSILLQGKLALYAINTQRRKHIISSRRQTLIPLRSFSKWDLLSHKYHVLAHGVHLLFVECQAEGGLANWPWMHSSGGSAKFWQFVRHRLTTHPAPRAPTVCLPSPLHPHSQPSHPRICIALHTFAFHTTLKYADSSQFVDWGKVAFKQQCRGGWTDVFHQICAKICQ